MTVLDFDTEGQPSPGAGRAKRGERGAPPYPSAIALLCLCLDNRNSSQLIHFPHKKKTQHSINRTNQIWFAWQRAYGASKKNEQLEREPQSREAWKSIHHETAASSSPPVVHVVHRGSPSLYLDCTDCIERRAMERGRVTDRFWEENNKTNAYNFRCTHEQDFACFHSYTSCASRPRNSIVEENSFARGTTRQSIIIDFYLALLATNSSRGIYGPNKRVTFQITSPVRMNRTASKFTSIQLSRVEFWIATITQIIDSHSLRKIFSSLFLVCNQSMKIQTKTYFYW